MSVNDGFPSDPFVTGRWFFLAATWTFSRRQARRPGCVSVGPPQIDLYEASSSCRPTTFASSPSARPRRSVPRLPNCLLPVQEGYVHALPPRDHSWGHWVPWESGTLPVRKLGRVVSTAGRESP